MAFSSDACGYFCHGDGHIYIYMMPPLPVNAGSFSIEVFLLERLLLLLLLLQSLLLLLLLRPLSTDFQVAVSRPVLEAV